MERMYVEERGFTYAIDADGLASYGLWTRLVAEALCILDEKGSLEANPFHVLSAHSLHGSFHDTPEVGRSGETGRGERRSHVEGQPSSGLSGSKQGFEETLSNPGFTSGDVVPGLVVRRSRVREGEEDERGVDGNRTTKKRRRLSSSGSDHYHQRLSMRRVCDEGKREDVMDADDKRYREDEDHDEMLKEEENVARLVGEMMLGLCNRRLDSMADENELERISAHMLLTSDQEEIMTLATSYVRNERAILLACKARWRAFLSDEEDD